MTRVGCTGTSRGQSAFVTSRPMQPSGARAGSGGRQGSGCPPRLATRLAHGDFEPRREQARLRLLVGEVLRRLALQLAVLVAVPDVESGAAQKETGPWAPSLLAIAVVVFGGVEPPCQQLPHGVAAPEPESWIPPLEAPRMLVEAFEQ